MGRFKFKVSDGINTNNQQQVFQIRATPIRILIDANKSVDIFPNTLQPILNSILLAKASSPNFTDDMEFTVVKPYPVNCKVIYKNDSLFSEIKTFTQRNINQGKIFIRHSGYRRSWQEIEYVNLVVSTSYATTLTNLALTVNISYTNINKHNYKELLKITMPSVKEGEQVVITENYFNPSRFIHSLQSIKPDVEVEFSIADKPHNGYLMFQGSEAKIGDIITKSDLEANELIYMHGNTDTTWDRIQLTVKILVPRSQNEKVLSKAITVDFPINIIPVNDQPFELVTVILKIEVLQGEEVRLNSQTLMTADLDTGPEGITYIVVTQPTSGMLVLESAPRTRLVRFTQKDINDEIIIFKHDGSPKVGGDIGLKVSDGVYSPIFFNMTVAVTPLEISVSPDSVVPFVQAQGNVVITNDYLKVSTTGDADFLAYKITQFPQFGKLLRRNSRINKFTQKDLNEGHLVYVQDYDSLGDDFFVCDIYLTNIDCNLDTVQFNVIMKPLVKQGPLLVTSGSQMAITRASLDASKLAEITNDIPRFDIVKPPRHGYIVKRNRKKREAKAKGNFSPVSSFTFEDIVYTRIYFIARSKGATQDSFSYSLSAKGVPPANGELNIQLDPAEDSPNGDSDTDIQVWPDEEWDGYSTKQPTGDKGATDDGSNSFDGKKDANDDDVDDNGVDGKDDDSDNGNEVSKSAIGSDGGSDSSMIIAIVVTLLIVLVVVVVLGVCYVKRRHHRRYGGGGSSHDMGAIKPRPYISSPLQLEQPHVFIEPQQDAGTPGEEEDMALMEGQQDHMYMNTSHVNKSHVGDGGDPRQRGRGIGRNGNGMARHSSMSEDSHMTTQLLDRSGEEEGIRDAGDRERHSSSQVGGRGSNASTDLTEWTLMDPDILQNCYNTTPVLRNNQYWL